MVVYTVFSAVAVYAQVMPKGNSEQELNLKGCEEHPVQMPVKLQKRAAKRAQQPTRHIPYQAITTYGKILSGPRNYAVCRASQPPAYIRHCAYIL